MVYLAGTDFDGSIPIWPRFADWGATLRLVIGPLLRGMPTAWVGEILYIALHTSALDAVQVEASYRSFVRDSAPIAPDQRVTTREDEVVELVLAGNPAAANSNDRALHFHGLSTPTPLAHLQYGATLEPKSSPNPVSIQPQIGSMPNAFPIPFFKTATPLRHFLLPTP